MSQHMIESESNPRVKRWKRLAADARAIRREGATLLEGIHLLQVVLEHPEIEVSAVILSADASTDEANYLAEQLASVKDAPVYVLPDRLYNALSPVEHGVGVMCEIKLPETRPASAWAETDALYLDGVQDAGNVGTLIRSAAAAGVRTIVGSPRTAGFWTPRVLRAGMGAHFTVNLVENMPIAAFKEAYKGRLVAADARGGENLFLADDYTLAGPLCWMMGAEGPGLSQEALEASDLRFWIPIEPGVESLNVGAAAAVCLFDSARRRQTR